MAQYYAVERSSEYLAHYGVRGMKWGVRKAIDRIGGNLRRSKQYMDAHKKLQKKMMVSQAVGGLAGSAIYAARHKSEFKSTKSTQNANLNNKRLNKVNLKSGNKALALNTKLGTAVVSRHPMSENDRAELRATFKKSTGNSRSLKKKALAASRRVDEAHANLSLLGKHGFGKTAREYRNANIAARDATNAYYDSLTKKQYAKLRRKHVG